MTAPTYVVLDLLNRFRYHKPDEQAILRHQEARNIFHQVALLVVESTTPGREQSLALTKLEEGLFWTNAAIARMDSDGNRL